MQQFVIGEKRHSIIANCRELLEESWQGVPLERAEYLIPLTWSIEDLAAEMPTQHT